MTRYRPFFMRDDNLSIAQLRDKIHNGETSDPLVFLDCIMQGQDPRDLSEIYRLIMDINESSFDHPSPDQWQQIVDFASIRNKYASVSLKESTAAAKQIAEYLHPKRKVTEFIDGNEGEGKLGTELTKDEILKFKEVFNAQY